MLPGLAGTRLREGGLPNDPPPHKKGGSGWGERGLLALPEQGTGQEQPAGELRGWGPAAAAQTPELPLGN